MLKTLNARHPELTGLQYSFDQSLNDLGDSDGLRQVLDYVLYSAGHKAPITYLQDKPINRFMFYRADTGWHEYTHEWYMWDISDHYPVLGFFPFERILGSVIKGPPSIPEASTGAIVYPKKTNSLMVSAKTEKSKIQATSLNSYTHLY